MAIGALFSGSLFAHDFLLNSIASLPEWRALAEEDVDAAHRAVQGIFEAFPTTGAPNESTTEQDLIWPVLEALGWTDSLRQQNLSLSGRADVPDGLLFKDAETKAQAQRQPEGARRYAFGLALVESKRWDRLLDRRSSRAGEDSTPSTQMLRYLRRVDDLTNGGLRWGVLTNGGRWRLYFAGARSVSEQFFEIDLAAALGLAQPDEDDLFAPSEEERRHAFKVFLLLFSRTAFLPGPADAPSVHQRAIAEGRFYEERVAESLAGVVFNQVFPSLASAIAASAPDADLEEVRQAALILLYRLLFILYAEDRDLLPVRDRRFDDYALRRNVRDDVRKRKDEGDVFSASRTRYWSSIRDLSAAINDGDAEIGLPPYNGGLFSREATPLLEEVALGDQVIADVIDALAFEESPAGRRYINYRDLSVQQLGSIYERLLEYELTPAPDGGYDVRPTPFARKGSGSYYTPDDLVSLILEETLRPLIDARRDAFLAETAAPPGGTTQEERRLAQLSGLDPAEKLLELKICDPAMGSGHFLVSLVDFLADEVIAAMAEAEAAVEWRDYRSPLAVRIEQIRTTIHRNATENGWTVDFRQLDDRHIVRRMVLKRCLYGVDKNLMAVELAKVALWLHTFTVGAPLSFLDHHLRCGDSLFGVWVRQGIEKVRNYGSPLLLHRPVSEALRSAAQMQIIEGLTDVEIAEAHRSADVFDDVKDRTGPLDALLKLIHAIDWLDLKTAADKALIPAFFDGQFGDPIRIAQGLEEPSDAREDGRRFAALLAQARTLIGQENFFNWQVAYPGVWSRWEDAERFGGFDAVVGNPPWDVYEFEDVSWFAQRDRSVALARSNADRKKLIAQLKDNADPLWVEYTRASERMAAGTKIIRAKHGLYSLLNRGKLNLYKLFVERAMMLVKPEGIVGMLVPSGIASDLTAAPFFKSVATEGRLKALYDFENKKVFFPDVHASFKFSIFVAGRRPTKSAAQCAFYLHSVAELNDLDRRFPLSAEDFARVNPKTGTAPIFRSRRDADLTTAIYERLPTVGAPHLGRVVWPIRYDQMVNMATDSENFRDPDQLATDEGAWPEGLNRWRSESGLWLPLYEGKLVQAFDHRAADILVKSQNVFRPGQQEAISGVEKQDPKRYPVPRYFMHEIAIPWKNHEFEWVVAFKDITASTNVRTMIAALIPKCAAGHTLPVLNMLTASAETPALAALITANLNALVFDFVARQKVHTTHFSFFILEQLPVIPPDRFAETRFGDRTAEEIVKAAVLELTYTAHDMAPFARDLGYVDEAGEVKPPFVWDEDRRLRLRAKLDAVFFHLYGITERDDVRYVYSTFPIVERQERAAHGRYLSCELCLAYMNALAAGQPDAEPEV
ncbi:MAG: restriction endonuclease [Marivibrio sp.]|uniref:Eco57I restriction-modification methylase domain-containing protein n=1 Tax=Marivibrio sp. TaxID=2039719 RepID=UPI0032EF9842